MPGLQPIRPADWNRATARHLLNRAGFGVPLNSVDYLLKVGPEAAVNAFVDFEKFKDVLEEPDFLVTAEMQAQYRQQIRATTDPQERQRLNNQFQQQERQAVLSLQAWWLNLMQFSTRPLQEKLTLFWSGHFATSAEKVRESRTVYQYNQTLRDHAIGNFRDLVIAVGKSPAMLRYLDNVQNVKGSPNENWARELMELFTLGIGAYTEKDIKEAARAFTGWAFVGDRFIYNIAQHDFGKKTFLGKEGLFDGEDIVDIIFEQPACAKFVCWKLWTFFVEESPSDEIIEALATVFRENNYELKPVLRTMFLSQAFYSSKVMGSQIKSPVQYTLGLMESLGITPGKNDTRQQRQIIILLNAMGQQPFYPPNVKGWYGNREWINTNTLLTRYNIAGGVVNGRIPESIREEMRLDETEDMAEMREREEALRRRINAPFNVTAWARPHDGKTVGEFVDFAVDFFVGRAVEAEQRTKLLEVLSGGTDESVKMTLSSINEIHLRGLVHMILSLAEYQLC